VVPLLKLQVKGGKKEYVKTLPAIVEAKELQAMIPELADAPRSYKETLGSSGVEVDSIRGLGQPTIHERRNRRCE
jgi:hypothetical protein